MRINAALLKNTFPLVAQTYGDDQELDIHVKVHKPRVFFKQNKESDISMSLEYDYGIKLAGDMNYLFYDKVNMAANLDLSI